MDDPFQFDEASFFSKGSIHLILILICNFLGCLHASYCLCICNFWLLTCNLLIDYMKVSGCKLLVACWRANFFLLTCKFFVAYMQVICCLHASLIIDIPLVLSVLTGITIYDGCYIWCKWSNCVITDNIMIRIMWVHHLLSNKWFGLIKFSS